MIRLLAATAAATFAAGALAAGSPGAAPRQDGAKFARFDDWFRRYTEGKIALAVVPGRLPSQSQLDTLGPEGELARVLHDCVRAESREAAERVLSLASFRFHDNAAIEAERHAAQMPGKVREAAVNALASFRSRTVLDHLARNVLLDRARATPERRVAAAHALGIAKDAGALLALFQASSDPSPAVRIAAIDAAVAAGGTRASCVLRPAGETAPDMRLRVLDATYRYLTGTSADPDGERDRVLSESLKQLESDDWRARDRVVDIVAAFPTRDAVPALIAALAAERERLAAGRGRKRVQVRIGDLLGTITGADIPPLDAGRWKVWWDVSGERFRLGGEISGRPRTRADTGTYFDIPIKTDHMVFVVDVSGSMNEPSGPPPIVTGDNGPPIMPAPAAWTKLERVKHELLRSMRSLQDTDLFQIVAFSDAVRSAFPTLAPANRANKKVAEKFVLGMRAHGGTGLYDALIAAMGLPDAGETTFTGEPDTVFVMSDGQPTVGSVTDSDEILRRVAEINRTARIQVHTLFAGEAFEPAARFLLSLARENRGEYRRIQER